MNRETIVGQRIAALDQPKPYELPRTKRALTAVFIAGRLENAKTGVSPQLQRLAIRGCLLPLPGESLRDLRGRLAALPVSLAGTIPGER